jgi:hypothetical protein
VTFWKKNSTILREKFPGLLEEIMRGGDDLAGKDLKVETTASGAPTLVINGLHVHSPRDPVREAQRLVEAGQACVETADIQSGANPGPVIILGFGLGYAAEAAANVVPSEKQPRFIIIVEKSLGLLRKAFELRDLSRLLSAAGVIFVPGGSGEGIITVLALLEKSIGGRSIPHIIRNRALTGIDEQWYASVESRIRAWTMRDDVNRATLKKFGKCWIRNLMRNMNAIRDLPGISRLAGLAAHVESTLPVFLAAAGPSLDNMAPLLPEIRKRCIIVAVDTSLRFLLRNGVDPDFVLVVDPQFWNSRHLNRCTGPRTRLIVESAVYPPVLRLPFKGAYLCGSLFPLGAFIEQRVDPKGLLGAGGSVATAAWDFARILGATQIWIAGLDLAFPGLKTHFKGAQFEEKALAESSKLNPAETWLIHALRDGIPFNAPAISGGQVLTDHRLSLYAAWFEESFRRYPTITNYSLIPGNLPGTGGLTTCGGLTTYGGLAIAGLELAGAETFLALPECREAIDRRLEAAFTRIEAEFFEPEAVRQRGERYENALALVVSGLEQIQNACARGIAIAEQALGENSGSADCGPVAREKTTAELDAINRLITSSEVKEIASFLLPPETLAAMGKLAKPEQSKNEKTTFHSYLESSIRLYRSLAEAAVL